MTTGDAFPGLTRTQINALIAAYVGANAAPLVHTHTMADITDLDAINEELAIAYALLL